MTKWTCHQCGHKNDIKDRICKGNGKKPNDPNHPGGKCYHKRQNLDKIEGGEEKKDD